MAHTIESRTNSPANDLREALDVAERLIVTVDETTVERLLVLFDDIERMFGELSQNEIDLRSEQVRWSSLQNRLYSKPLPITKAAARAGGMAKLRAKHPPAEGDWWRLDAIVMERRRRSAIRTIVTIVVIVLVMAGLYWAVNTLFPPNPDAVAMVEATSSIDTYVRVQDWDGALGVVERSLERLPNEPELWIWKTVLLEQLGDSEGANQALDEAKELLADVPSLLWVTLGNTRLQVGDISGADDAATQALAANSEDPQANFLKGNVAEATGDVTTAMDMYNKTYELAQDSNPELAVIARVRLGQMLQQPVLPFEASTETPVATPTP
jgi:tetratricopeptide (TPR) repeat protein